MLHPWRQGEHGERAQFGRRPAPLLRLAALLLGAGLEVEHAVLAVPGRAPADAAVQLLPWVVVAHDVPALDAPDQRAVHPAGRPRRGATDLAEHDEPWKKHIEIRG